MELLGKEGFAKVSIHAPTWGATLVHADGKATLFVSIHAPTWGATVEQVKAYISRQFQSTHPHGVRRRDTKMVEAQSMFQSTHPHGVRLLSLFRKRTANWFQSTHPHGVRLHIQ